VDNLFQYFVRELNKLLLNNIKSIEKKKKKSKQIVDFDFIIRLTLALDNLSLIPMISKIDMIDAINRSGKILKKRKMDN
jgi:hypothetical protein